MTETKGLIVSSLFDEALLSSTIVHATWVAFGICNQKNRVLLGHSMCAVTSENLFSSADDWISNVGNVQLDTVLDPRKLDQSSETILDVRGA